MICKEIIRIIEEAYPTACAMPWDNVGLLAGRTDKEISTVYIAVDLTEQVLEEAIEAKADLILTHHPLIFSPLSSVTNEDFIGKRVVTLLQNDISYYAMHTNYDILRMGILAAERFGLKDTEVLESAGDGELGIGRIGTESREMTLAECCGIVKDRFGLESVKLFGEPGQTVRRIAICPGSGKSVLHTSIKRGADVLITGDIGHHEGIDAVAQGMAVIDAGHYGLEYIYMEDMKRFLEKRCPSAAVKTASVKQPFQMI